MTLWGNRGVGGGGVWTWRDDIVGQQRGGGGGVWTWRDDIVGQQGAVWTGRDDIVSQQGAVWPMVAKDRESWRTGVGLHCAVEGHSLG